MYSYRLENCSITELVLVDWVAILYTFALSVTGNLRNNIIVFALIITVSVLFYYGLHGGVGAVEEDFWQKRTHQRSKRTEKYTLSQRDPVIPSSFFAPDTIISLYMSRVAYHNAVSSIRLTYLHNQYDLAEQKSFGRKRHHSSGLYLLDFHAPIFHKNLSVWVQNTLTLC